MYIAANQKLNRPSGISPKQLPNLMKIIFGTKIGPNVIKRTDANNAEFANSFYVNLKVKTTPIGVQVKLPAPSSPLATLQTQSPVVSTTIATPVFNNHKAPVETPDPSKDKKFIRKVKILENAKENDISNKLLHAVEESRKLSTQSVIITKTHLVSTVACRSFSRLRIVRVKGVGINRLCGCIFREGLVSSFSLILELEFSTSFDMGFLKK